MTEDSFRDGANKEKGIRGRRMEEVKLHVVKDDSFTFANFLAAGNIYLLD